MDYRKIGMLQSSARSAPYACEAAPGSVRIEARNLDELGHAALLERLARALARRRTTQ